MKTEDIGLAGIGYIEDLYQSWKSKPDSVSSDWQELFSRLDYPGQFSGGPAAGTPAAGVPEREYKQTRLDSLIWAYRDVGYLHAKLNPLEGYLTPEMWYQFRSVEGVFESLGLQEFGLSEKDLDEEFSAGKHLTPSRGPLRQILAALEQTYCGPIGAEFLHIQNRPIRRWLIERIETANNTPSWSSEQREEFHRDLIRAEEFERFIQSHYVGQKRFSLEGAEVLIPALHYLIDTSARQAVQEIVLGMAHRGRLNVLTNILGKPYSEVFATFEGSYRPHDYGGSGDVKYHLGHSREHGNSDGSAVIVNLLANPSHLEAVDPVVQGRTRAIQHRRGDVNRKKVLPVLIHGDAAFSGQGVVSETLNLFQLRGYRTGGTVHIIINNQIGFTTASRDSRSTFFSTDIAKSIPTPIFHVNGDNPDYVIRAVDLAFQFRQKFGFDAVVDIFCYRRYGHNEADEPSFTHPLMYRLIKNHPSTAAINGKNLERDGVIDEKKGADFRREVKAELEKALGEAKDPSRGKPSGELGPESGRPASAQPVPLEGEWGGSSLAYSHESVETGVKAEVLSSLSDILTTVPDSFRVHPKLKRMLEDRKKRFAEGEGIDWAFAESLSFGSLLREGFHIRLSGEDSGRGTFSQRHAVWWDIQSDTPKSHIPLGEVRSSDAPSTRLFSVYDSPLSEFSILGFEYGYSQESPKFMTIWEAQFGDFANGAQVIIDNFIAAGEAKWRQPSGLVMLLPHGYEGQGPEHSSAHMERYLMLSAEDNIQVCYPTTPAQYFHLLRRQMKRPFRKPLVIMTPKSLLRHKRAVSPVKDLVSGGFQEIIGIGGRGTLMVFCSGKIYYDLLEQRERMNRDDVTLVRFEQICPFPEEPVRKILEAGSPTRLIWAQEEPRNRGAWRFVRDRMTGLLHGRVLAYAGRAESASPATGSFQDHTEQRDAILNRIFG